MNQKHAIKTIRPLPLAPSLEATLLAALPAHAANLTAPNVSGTGANSTY